MNHGLTFRCFQSKSIKQICFKRVWINLLNEIGGNVLGIATVTIIVFNEANYFFQTMRTPLFSNFNRYRWFFWKIVLVDWLNDEKTSGSDVDCCWEENQPPAVAVACSACNLFYLQYNKMMIMALALDWITFLRSLDYGQKLLTFKTTIPIILVINPY